MELNNIFGGDTIKAADLKGREFTLVIASVDLKKFDDGPKLIITFQNAKKALIANKTNSERIGMMYGTNTDGWIGREISLYADLVNFQGKMVEAIRIRPPMRRVEQAPAPAPAPRQQAVQQRDGYELSTGTDRHPNAPGGLDDDIPF